MRSVLLLALLCAAVIATGVSAQAFDEANDADMSPEVLTALQTYVAAPDANYGWVYHPEYDMKGMGYKVLWLNMTSQRWLTDADVDKSIWTHWTAVIVPDTLQSQFSQYALLWIGGGHNTAKPPSIWDKDLMVCAAIAQELGTIVTALYAIPNAPIRFAEEQPTPKARSEDALIAWTWKHYIADPSNAEWLARLPMTKASIRAMDAVSEFWQQQSGNSLNNWLVAGASKRGWTTWTVGACDPQRVVAIIPMVLDELNFVKNIKHHFAAYGGWSFALDDYYALNFTAELDNPNVQLMMDIVDPINYVDILTMPKLIISTGGDEFLLPDNVDYFWSQLQGEAHFHIFPNLEHTMIENIPAVVETVRGFALMVMAQEPRPAYDWTVGPDGTITVQVDAANPPSLVQCWSALTIDGNERRDFRLVAIMPVNGTMQPWLHPVFWNSSVLAPVSSTPSTITYSVLLTPPSEGWIAFVVELQFPGLQNSTFRVSSAPSILPQTFPYPTCEGAGCYGTLV